ncbi:DNA recombination protein RmuC [Janibacter sp. GXQ6167]|uniref:DNA recombination protein RmuC n=1 Tax=Janibacter sp. GXQ6167 TaxID=3240791 RepID=UPI00352433FB
MEILFAIVVGLALGALGAWLALRGQGAARFAAATAERDVLRERVADLEASLIHDARTATELAPMRETLRRVEGQVSTLERDRMQQFATIREALADVADASTTVGRETAALTASLRVSSVRGSWGEVQLRRVLELSGMLPRCDFDTQAKGENAAGSSVRPDVVVHLPGDKHLVIDAKTPMSRWLEAQSEDAAEDPRTRDRLLGEHAADLARHVRALGTKEYWTAIGSTPEMVVCFVPTDATLAAALAHDPELHERAMSERVVLASPGTLLALLRTVAFAWQQDALAHDARELLQVGRDLHHRLATMGKHTARMGRAIQSSVEAYNQMVGALETRVLVSARRMRDLGVPGEEIVELGGLEQVPRPLTAAELLDEATERRPELDFGPAEQSPSSVRRASGA